MIALFASILSIIQILPFQTSSPIHFSVPKEPVVISTCFPLNATPYLKIVLTPLAVISVSYLRSSICARAAAESCFSLYNNILMKPGGNPKFQPASADQAAFYFFICPRLNPAIRRLSFSILLT
jgi:hypothetical protein